MVFVSKLLTALFLPPGCIILFLIILIFFVRWKIKVFLGMLVLFFYAISIQPVSDFLLKPLENAWPPLSEHIDADWPQAIVVLGSGTVQGSPEEGEGHDALSSGALKRAVYAFTLCDTFQVPLVFTGGKVFDYDQEPEAFAAGRLFETLGLDSSRIILETESRNTWENAREIAKLFSDEETVLERVILVTSAYHVKRGVFCFESNGISVIPAPTDYKCDRGRRYDFFSFMPSMSYLENTWLALHEYIGLLYYVIAFRK
jgi:uncharacterized SAM-binding protein YcdF (DUF218 family)